MARLFIAIDLPERIKDDLIDTYQAIPGADWIDEARLHCTLRFIGNTPPHIEESLIFALRSIHINPFSVTLKATGFFPPRKEPRILWVGIDNAAALIHLQQKIEKACVSIGLPPETRNYHPHITVARLKRVPMEKVAHYIVTNSLFSTEPFEISQFHLYSSHLGKQKAQYEKIVSFLLKDLM